MGKMNANEEILFVSNFLMTGKSIMTINITLYPKLRGLVRRNKIYNL